MPPRECPGQTEWRAFVLGEVPQDKLDELTDHLEGCPACEGVVQGLDQVSDPALLALRRQVTAPTAAPGDGDPVLPGAPAESERTEPTESDSGGVPLPAFIGPYEILAELGRGGMGVVYQARHPTLRRVVALKMLLGGLFAGPQYRLRFLSEAEAVARMQHPHIVQLFEIAEHQGQPYFTLEYVEGGSLENALDKPQTPRRAARLAETLARAVHYAHLQGIVHRDLKPANILLTRDGQPKITDFGVAKLLEGSASHTTSGLVIGTAEYMAPEQADGRRRVGPPADIYALGSVLYALLAGHPPFQSASVLETLEKVKFHEPVPLRQLQPQLPRDLETICLKCLEKEPERRYARAAMLADDLERFLTGKPIRARPVGAGTRLWRWCRRNSAVASLLGVVMVLLTVLSIGALLGMKNAVERAEEEARARVQLEYQLYLTNIALGERECAANNMRRLAQLLDDCPEPRRGWEWHYLKRRLYEKDLVLGRNRGIWFQGMVFTPDGESLATTDRNGILHLWGLRNPQDVRILPHQGKRNVVDLAVSPDGEQFALAHRDRTVRLVDTVRGERLRTLQGHTSAVLRVVFSPDGRHLISSSWDSTVNVWNMATGQKRTLLGHTHAVADVSCSPDGKYLATASNDRTVKVWEFASGEAVHTLRGHDRFVRAVVFSPDGKRLASAGTDQTIRLWDVATGKSLLVLRGHTGDVSALAFHAGGERLASGSRDRTIKLWDVSTGEEMITLHGHADTITNLAFSPDGNRLASTGWDKTVRIWDATPLQAPPRYESRIIHAHADSVQGLAFEPDGRYLASASLDSSLKVWDVRSGELVHTIRDNPSQVWTLAISPDGKQLASLGGDAHLKFFDLATGEPIRSCPPHPQWGTSVVFSPDQQFVASASRDGTVKLWDSSSGELIREFRGKRIWVNGVAFSPDSRWLATANDGATVELWEVATGNKVRELQGHRLTVSGVAFHPDGKHLASCSRDETLKIWDPHTGEIIRTLLGHTDRVYGVAYSPDGKVLASVSADETVRIWDATTGEELQLLRGHTNIVTCLAFSPDGQSLATGGRDHTIRIWPVSPPR